MVLLNNCHQRAQIFLQYMCDASDDNHLGRSVFVEYTKVLRRIPIIVELSLGMTTCMIIGFSVHDDIYSLRLDYPGLQHIVPDYVFINNTRILKFEIDELIHYSL